MPAAPLECGRWGWRGKRGSITPHGDPSVMPRCHTLQGTSVLWSRSVPPRGLQYYLPARDASAPAAKGNERRRGSRQAIRLKSHPDEYWNA